MSDSHLKFSLIIPVYNVEAYLTTCIESCEKQDIPQSEYELIVVNDGSTDSSLSIIEQLSAKYSNISVISQINKGLSGARNTGIKNISGEYVWFIDSDDFISENVLGGLYFCLKEFDLEILHIGYQYVDNGGNKLAQLSLDRNKEIMDGISFLNKIQIDGFYAWSFIFKTSLLIKNSFGFKEGIIFEDNEIIPEIILKSKRISSYCNVAYCYRQRENSLVHTVTLKMTDDLFSVCKKYKNYSQDITRSKQEMEIFRNLFTEFMISYYVLLSKIEKREYPLARQRKIIAFKEFPKLYHSSRLTRMKTVCVDIYNISPVLFFLLLRLKFIVSKII